MSHKGNKTFDVIKFFLFDTIMVAIVYLIVFGIALLVSEAIYFLGSFFENAEYIILIAKGVKGLMLFADTLIMVAFLYYQTISAIKHIQRLYKEDI